MKNQLQSLIGKTITEKEIEFIINVFNNQEKKNIAYIEKLNRKRKIELKQISGGLKQTINDHGPITKNLIGSATKRIWGSLLSNQKSITLWDKIKRYFKF